MLIVQAIASRAFGSHYLNFNRPDSNDTASSLGISMKFITWEVHFHRLAVHMQPMYFDVKSIQGYISVVNAGPLKWKPRLTELGLFWGMPHAHTLPWFAAGYSLHYFQGTTEIHC